MAKKTKKKYTSIGGQALMEGIMMKGPEKAVMAVRRMDGSITTEAVTVKKPTIWNKIFIIRGVVGFVQSMAMGTKMLMRSADFVIEDEERAARAEEEAALVAEMAEKESAEAEADAPLCEECAATAGDCKPEAECAECGETAAEEVPAAAEAVPADESAEQPEKAAGEMSAPAKESVAEHESVAAAAAQSVADEGKSKGKQKKSKKKKGKDKAKKDSSSENGFFTGLATVLGFGLAILLFFFMPTWAFKGLLMVLPEEYAAVLRESTVWKSVIEGVLKLIIFVIYMLLVSNMKEIKRLFQYHGAEHKTIFCYEAGLELTVENVRKFKRFHPRCGTSFLILMLLVGILAGICITALLPAELDNNPWIRPLIKVALIPLIMGVGYELLKFAGKHDNIITRIISAPGLWMQRISTREPDDSQIECAIAALKPVIPEDGGDMS